MALMDWQGDSQTDRIGLDRTSELSLGGKVCYCSLIRPPEALTHDKENKFSEKFSQKHWACEPTRCPRAPRT